MLDKTGKVVTLESLSGKRLAVGKRFLKFLIVSLDISLWLCQAAAGYNTYSFGTRAPHIQLLVSRIGKLLFYKIHPIFVFDGKNVPALKKQVLVGFLADVFYCILERALTSQAHGRDSNEQKTAHST